MKHLIDKDAVLGEIDRRFKEITEQNLEFPSLTGSGVLHEYVIFLSFINALEVNDVDTWHLQEKENIYDAINDWGLHTFACIMKDGTIQKFNGIWDEDCEGHINIHIEGVNDDYDNVDDIVKWIEII